MHLCQCDEEISQARWDLGYRVCLDCGERESIRVRQGWTIVPLHKSSYTLVTDKSILKQLNKIAAF
jgi:hypothetical protein